MNKTSICACGCFTCSAAVQQLVGGAAKPGVMMFTAVKFGRMSKKQRERVEDEANFHKQRLGLIPDTPSLTLDSGKSSPSPGNNNNESKDSIMRYEIQTCFILVPNLNNFVCA